MTSRPASRPDWLMLLLTGVVFGLVALYTYGALFHIPLLGFDFDRDGRVDGLTATADGPATLRTGDVLIRVGDVAYADHLANLRAPLLLEAIPAPGEVLPLRVSRAGQVLEVAWRLPVPDLTAYLGRAVSQWMLAWVFLGCALFAYILVRPRDLRWRLFVAFNALTALWLAAGTLSLWRLWESALVLRMMIWVCVPVYLFWHWHFPQPVRPLPLALRLTGYLAGAILAAAEVAGLMPRDAYFAGFGLAVAGSLLILGAKYVWQPDRRGEFTLLFWAGLFALAPTLLAVLWISLFGPAGRNIFGALIGLPLLPLAYLYVIYRHQMGDLELRANQAVGGYMFLLLLASLISLAAFSLFAQPEAAGWGPWLAIALAVGAMLITALGLAPFQRWVEKHILRIPAPQLAGYSAQLAIRPTREGLVGVLRDQAARRLLIRQSALFTLEADGALTPVYTALDEAPWPTPAAVQAVLAQPDLLRAGDPAAPLPWVRVALPLRLGEAVIGAWLLGRRDPDDFYSQGEILQLRALADFAAVALAHNAQTERLRELYQANIDRHEAERGRLALELHDDILNELALLARGEASTPEAYHRVVQRIRQIISGLRPVMLTYGLASALEQLGDDLSERASGQLRVVVEVRGEGERYPAHVEQHLFRIVQQAAENAVKHAQASGLRLTGALSREAIMLRIEDDGVGLPLATRGDLGALIRQRHFGLAGMRERAHLVGAELEVESAPRQGTRITVRWRASAALPDGGGG